MNELQRLLQLVEEWQASADGKTPLRLGWVEQFQTIKLTAIRRMLCENCAMVHDISGP
jgi:hypothetical protein